MVWWRLPSSFPAIRRRAQLCCRQCPSMTLRSSSEIPFVGPLNVWTRITVAASSWLDPGQALLRMASISLSKFGRRTAVAASPPAFRGCAASLLNCPLPLLGVDWTPLCNGEVVNSGAAGKPLAAWLTSPGSAEEHRSACKCQGASADAVESAQA